MGKIKPVGKAITPKKKEEEKEFYLKNISKKIQELVINAFKKNKFPEPLSKHSAKIEKGDNLYEHIEKANEK
ncbi:MAG: hypothetical protein AMS24_04480 [Chlamydiae bacterium SM23_39]|nr:MAG: hypothetical protein AMS24_04480 [Chlamydiae bacterium SM23_39]